MNRRKKWNVTNFSTIFYFWITPDISCPVFLLGWQDVGKLRTNENEKDNEVSHPADKRLLRDRTDFFRPLYLTSSPALLSSQFTYAPSVNLTPRRGALTRVWQPLRQSLNFHLCSLARWKFEKASFLQPPNFVTDVVPFCQHSLLSSTKNTRWRKKLNLCLFCIPSRKLSCIVLLFSHF